MTRADRIRELVAALDRTDGNVAEDAQFALTVDYGGEALEPLLEAAPTFARFGRLCAIELFQAFGDRRAGAVLIPWLMSEDDTEREWSARALGDLGVSEAVPHLLRALAAADRRGTPPDWSEPVSIRHALAVLGARRVVIPQEIARLQIDDELGPAWPVDVLGDVLRRLADARQVVLYFQYWTRRPEYDPSAWYAVTQTRRGSTRTTGRRLRAMLAEREGRRSGRRIDHATRLGVR